MNKSFSNLKRKRNKIPGFVKQALQKRKLEKEFKLRPAYQQNDYVGWINDAKKQETKNKRLKQMLDELEKGGVYMKMNHPASAKN